MKHTYFLNKGFVRHTEHMFSVKNQNGLNNALYHYFDVDSDDEKKEIRKMLQNWPKKYPRTIIIIDESFECNQVSLETFDVEDFYEGKPFYSCFK